MVTWKMTDMSIREKYTEMHERWRVCRKLARHVRFSDRLQYTEVEG